MNTSCRIELVEEKTNFPIRNGGHRTIAINCGSSPAPISEYAGILSATNNQRATDRLGTSNEGLGMVPKLLTDARETSYEVFSPRLTAECSYTISEERFGSSGAPLLGRPTH
jgi:hypothetical protein